MKKLRYSVLIILLFVSVDLSSQSSWDPLGDKKKHIASGVFFSGMTSFIVYDNNGERRKNALLWSVVSSVLIGTVKELADHNKPENTPITDIGYTVVGGLVGALTVDFVLKKYENRGKRRLKRVIKKESIR